MWKTSRCITGVKRQPHKVVSIILDGRLDTSIAYDLTKALLYEGLEDIEFRVDVSEIDTVSDSGVALLMMFVSRAQRMQAKVTLVGCHGCLESRVSTLSELYPLLLKDATRNVSIH